MAEPYNHEKLGFADVRRAVRLSVAPMMDWMESP